MSIFDKIRGRRHDDATRRAKEHSDEIQRSLEEILTSLSDLPRENPSMMDAIKGRIGSGFHTTYIYVDLQDIVQKKAVFDVPFLTSDGEVGIALLKQRHVEPLTERAVSSGQIDLKVTYHQLPEYPVLQFLFIIHDRPGNPLKSESLPRLTDGNVIDFLKAVLTKHRISLDVYSGNECRHIATADLELKPRQVEVLERAVANAIAQWNRQRPPASHHNAAADRFMRENPL